MTTIMIGIVTAIMIATETARKQDAPLDNAGAFCLCRYELQQLTCCRQCAGFFVVEELSSIIEQLELSWQTILDFYFNAFLCSFLAQAPGRASQVESKEAALYLDHFQFLQISFATRTVFT